ncbi:hypothetical protein JGH11_11405 [Dysgonomonas sp. Marseille-P4677]|uniref:hypothetical protein n=1 Tax=Dysgonomonas sp. Marseille-P4677 TaxID=2364790 RepID=UPI00191177C4|nr:hypothetical protein [Dysgonomonas sp. Marseille-P4677]MBK5721478.1 hypothetical protein [Dysgonomonas sp. Marseille-P4677]
MKSYKLLAIVFSIVTLFIFSSCESDHYEWRRGTLNLTTEFDDEPIYTDNRGRFNFSYDLRAEDIKGIDTRRLDIVDVESYSSEIFLFRGELFRVGDLINIRLAADGVNGVGLRMIVVNNNGGREAMVIDEDLYLLKRFMADMAYRLARNGRLVFYIDGELLDIFQPTYFDFEVVNDFNFEIRY